MGAGSGIPFTPATIQSERDLYLFLARLNQDHADLKSIVNSTIDDRLQVRVILVESSKKQIKITLALNSSRRERNTRSGSHQITATPLSREMNPNGCTIS